MMHVQYTHNNRMQAIHPHRWHANLHESTSMHALDNLPSIHLHTPASYRLDFLARLGSRTNLCASRLAASAAATSLDFILRGSNLHPNAHRAVHARTAL